MWPKGVIYESEKSDLHGEVRLVLPLLTRVIYHFLRATGAGLVAAALIALIFAYGPIIEEEISYSFKGQSYQVVPQNPFLVDFSQAEKVAEVQREAAEFGVNSYFSVVIPKIGAASNVIANVDASDEKEYLEALKKGIAHARGSNFPGQGRNVFLFSHSTDSPTNFLRYNAVFFLLRKLEVGDRIIVFFADARYEYQVEDKVFAAASDVSWITNQGTSETLLLQTCDPPGTNWRRLMVVAKPYLGTQGGNEGS